MNRKFCRVLRSIWSKILKKSHIYANHDEKFKAKNALSDARNCWLARCSICSFISFIYTPMCGWLLYWKKKTNKKDDIEYYIVSFWPPMIIYIYCDIMVVHWPPPTWTNIYMNTWLKHNVYCILYIVLCIYRVYRSAYFLFSIFLSLLRILPAFSAVKSMQFDLAHKCWFERFRHSNTNRHTLGMLDHTIPIHSYFKENSDDDDDSMTLIETSHWAFSLRNA